MRDHVNQVISRIAVLGLVFIGVFIGAASAAHGQDRSSLTTEVDVTTGYSTEDQVTALAAQVRLFGELKPKLRFNFEGTWAHRSDDDGDAFGAAYPYNGRVQASEAYGERMFQRGSALVAVRGGQYRSPFGIYSRSDYAYTGFLRAPLLRYDGYWALSNNFLERGVDVTVGTPRLYVETSLGRPADIGTSERRTGWDGVIRLQGYYRALIVGISRISSEPYAPIRYARGRLGFTGVDARWTHNGVQLRAEWMTGQPWQGPTTHGWYGDAIVHRRFMGPVTAVARFERLTYTATGPFQYHDETYSIWQGWRQTIGGRIRLPAGFTLQVNGIRQSEALADYGRTALDAALTYSIRP
jgi:hypothetical protein